LDPDLAALYGVPTKGEAMINIEASLRRKFLGVITVMLLIGLGAGCVSRSKYRALEESGAAERMRLLEEVSALKSQKAAQEAALTSDKKKLQEEIAVLELQRADLERKKEALDRQVAALNDRVFQMERQTEEIKAQKDEEINRLKGTYDNLVNDLKGEIEKGEVKVTQIRDRLSVNMVEKVLFDSGRAEVKKQGKEVLQKVGKILGSVTDKEIRIEGFTDNVPIGEALRKRFPTNWELSTQRATNVLRFLQEEAGVDGKYLSAVGYGPFRPVATNDTPQGRSENRRIEIVLAPLDLQEVFKDIR
jgi:chemotaxis protein MotB